MFKNRMFTSSASTILGASWLTFVVLLTCLNPIAGPEGFVEKICTERFEVLQSQILRH